ncbi:MAG: DUF4129 domain-containing protein [Thermoplasmata archaeon]
MGAGARTLSRPAALLVLFIVAAVAFGIAAALIASPAVPTPPQFASPGDPGFLILEVVSFAVLALVVGGLALFLWQRFRGGSLPFPGSAVLVALVVLLMLVGFVEVSHLVSSSSLPMGSNPGGSGSGNSSGGSLSGNNSTNPTLGGGSAITPLLPSWWTYAAVIGIAVIVAALLLPFLLARTGPLRSRPPSDATLRSSVAEALQTLRDGSDASPRERIIRAYARLLERVTWGTADLSALTPREIRALCVERMRIRSGTAHELTGLFEEARYSTHPLTNDAVIRAEGALERALADMGRSSIARLGSAT